jgi:hypothetical protein
MNNIKILIQATNIHIANCDENIKEEMVEPPRASGALPPEFDGGDVWG